MSTHDDIIQRLSRIETKVDRIAELPCLHVGSSSNPIVRIDRLEQSEEKRKWTVRALIGAVIAVVAKLIHGAIEG